MSDVDINSVGLSGVLTDTGHRLVARVYYADTDFSRRRLSWPLS